MHTHERLRAALGDRYEIEHELGRGGMAVVYLARDIKHGRRVALKVLRPELGAAMGSVRFQREIEIAARLNHPNILALYDSGEAAGLLYFVMPFVEGESLRDRLDREGALSLEDATRIVREVGSALAYAHALGLVHRDVKPENTLFQAGHALVCDFGIAKAASEAQDRLTQTGLAVGTLRYMSPEQLTGGDVDARSDVYALGCVLYEMLAGGEPFEASNPHAVLAKKLMGEVPDVTATRADVPPTVRDVIAKALAPTPSDRFASADDLVAALELATTQVAIERDARRRRRGRMARTLAAAATVAGIGVAAWWGTKLVGGPAITTLAVMPGPDRAGAATPDFFAQGVYQDLTLELAKAGVRVKSPNSVARFVGSERPIAEIARELAVGGVVFVSASASAGRVDAELMLVDAASEDVLWGGSFREDERNILTLYGAMASAIAREIAMPLSAEALARIASYPQVDPAVYEALLQARFHLQTLSEEGLDTALEYYRFALTHDSTSAAAWNGVASVWLFRAQQGLVSAEVANLEAGPAADRAIALDPTLPQVQASLALRKTWGEWSWREAEAAFHTALGQDPLDSVTRAYFSLLLLYLGREREAVEQLALAVEQDPFNTLVQGLRAQSLNARGEHEEAERVLQQALLRDRNAPFLLATLRTTYHSLGRYDEAIDMWRSSLSALGSYRAGGDGEAVAALERGLAEGGYEGALRAVAELYVERAKTEHVTPWQIATLYTRAGMGDEALHYLELAVAARDQNCPYLSVEPIFDFLRDEPRFQALIDTLGLPR